MADIRNTSNKGSADFAGSIKSVRTFGGEVGVLVTAGPVFSYFVGKLYGAMAYNHIANTQVGALPFSLDEFTLYCMDALHVRVQRVRREPSSLPYMGWALPAPVASMLAALGEVTHEAPYIRIVPVWSGPTGFELDRSRWNDLTVRIQSVESTIGVLLVDTIERDPKGRDELMSLIPETIDEPTAVEVLTNETVQAYNVAGVEAVYRYEPVDAISAAQHLILGLFPAGAEKPSLLHPFHRPGYKLDYDVAMLVVERLAQVKSA